MQQYVDVDMMKYQRRWRGAHIWKGEIREEGGGCHMNVIISAEGNYSPPSTPTYLCCPCLTAYALFVFVKHTCINKPKSSVRRHGDAPCVCVYVRVIMCQWCRTVAITSRQRGLPDGVSAVQEGRCAAFIKLTVPGSQERLTHCGWGMAEQGMQPHAPLCTPSLHSPTDTFL